MKELRVTRIAFSKENSLRWLWLSVCVLALDQITKQLAVNYLQLDDSIHLLTFFSLTLEHNAGAAFSFLSHAGNFATWLFVGTASVISIILSISLYHSPKNNILLNISLALLLGGAVGNLLDRLVYGYVIDFMHFHAFHHSFPVFNVADMAITFGALMLLRDFFKRPAS